MMIRGSCVSCFVYKDINDSNHLCPTCVKKKVEYLIYPIRLCEKCMQNLQLNNFDVEKQRYILKIKELEKKNFDLDFELHQLKTHLHSYSTLIEYAEEQKQKNILVNDTIDRFISDLTKEIRQMEGTSYE
jgi:vacuolar-type H+-ATPase subunit I/STV1